MSKRTEVLPGTSTRDRAIGATATANPASDPAANADSGTEGRLPQSRPSPRPAPAADGCDPGGGTASRCTHVRGNLSRAIVVLVTCAAIASQAVKIAVASGIRRRPRQVGGEAGMSTAEYAVGTIAACAFAAVLYQVVTGDSIVSALRDLISSALSSLS